MSYFAIIAAPGYTLPQDVVNQLKAYDPTAGFRNFEPADLSVSNAKYSTQPGFVEVEMALAITKGQQPGMNHSARTSSVVIPSSPVLQEYAQFMTQLTPRIENNRTVWYNLAGMPVKGTKQAWYKLRLADNAIAILHIGDDVQIAANIGNGVSTPIKTVFHVGELIVDRIAANQAAYTPLPGLFGGNGGSVTAPAPTPSPLPQPGAPAPGYTVPAQAPSNGLTF